VAPSSDAGAIRHRRARDAPVYDGWYLGVMGWFCAAERAHHLAWSSLGFRRLLPIADTNLARAYDKADNAWATDTLNYVLEAQTSKSAQSETAELHRLTLAAERYTRPAHAMLCERADPSDSTGSMGQGIRAGGMPSPVWL
jgi:hypothetical protein